MSSMTCDGVLLDLDGVLADSTRAVERHWQEFAGRIGRPATSVLQAAHGRRSIDVIADLVAPERVAREAAWFEDLEVDDLADVTALPGACDLLATLPPGSWGIVTSCGHRLARARLEAAELRVPDVVIAAEDVRNGKPDPEGYRLGARALGLPPTSTIVFEDAPSGVAAGQAAGATVVGLLTTHRRDDLAVAHLVPDLSGVTIAASSGSTITLRLTHRIDE